MQQNPLLSTQVSYQAHTFILAGKGSRGQNNSALSLLDSQKITESLWELIGCTQESVTGVSLSSSGGIMELLLKSKHEKLCNRQPEGTENGVLD